MTEETSLDEFLATAELAGTEFTAGTVYIELHLLNIDKSHKIAKLVTVYFILW